MISAALKSQIITQCQSVAGVRRPLISPFDLVIGDCLNFEPETLVGRLIAAPQRRSSVTGKKYSHTAITYAPGVIVEAAKKGVIIADPSRWKTLKKPIEVWSWPERLSEAQQALIREYLSDHLGDPYPYAHLGIILWYLATGRRQTARIRSRYSVCSVLATRAHRHAGLDVVPGYDESVETPTDITEGNLVLRGYLDVSDVECYAAQYRSIRTQFLERIAA